ncbi:hypothetical protein Hanom_Chr08g00717401 [Helianthus anomalus]
MMGDFFSYKIKDTCVYLNFIHIMGVLSTSYFYRIKIYVWVICITLLGNMARHFNVVIKWSAAIIRVQSIGVRVCGWLKVTKGQQ